MEVSASMQNPPQEAKAAAPQLGDEAATDVRIRRLIQEKLCEKHLNLPFCRLRDAEAIALARELEGNNNITAINLTGNEITYEGAKALANALRVNRSISEICLEGNYISNKGAEAFPRS